MTLPLFSPGAAVRLRRNPQSTGEGTFEVVRVMPSEGLEPRYHIRNIGQTSERVVVEHELSKAGVDPAAATVFNPPYPQKR